MKKSLLITVFTLSVFVSFSRAQNVRIQSLGGIKYGLIDQDNSLNIYDFGKNPAWLINDEKQIWLKVTPSFDRQWGDYKRLYDFKSSNQGGMSFTGLKPLGNNGTFLGSASYVYEQRKDVTRILKRNPYDGQSFFPTDTTTGNFKYDGPVVGFAYSFELFPKMFLGTAVNYQVLDGLKNIYSMAKTVYRDVNGKAGLAYAFSDNCVLGLDYGIFSNQESLEMKNEISQTEVQIFNFRGDTYSTFIRKTSVEQKIRQMGQTLGTQVYCRPSENLELALKGEYLNSGAKVLLPQQNLKEFEEGYSSLENYNIDFEARCRLSNNLTLGAELGYSKDDSWSKNSELNLLLWKWDVKRTVLGLGATYDLKALDLLVGFDYEVNLIKADSSKYIDSKFRNISSTNGILRLGGEQRIYGDLYLRAGYNYGHEQFDIVYGGSDVAVNYGTFGLGLDLFGARVDVFMQYGKAAPQSYSDISRDHLSAAATLRLNSF
ncbi:MAG: hypothetical protein HF314_12335 [Ignavibacteria bacterium]|jgi:hypothetical protein|nr:hypothetical protein [Ignavibacteria bacterium]MCU7503860.1 hypothetical protein [Ignavibacteria bacterium]MCU7515919.1 hypothetical protein [Ignavibacteria bacterium]